MTSPSPPIQHMLSLFEQQPCWKIDPLAAKLRYAVPSVRRFLAQAGYFSSVTHNGTWYTLKSIPRFNRNGLWFYQEIGFSKAGSLTGAIIDLIGRSHTGMSAEDVGDTLRCRCHSVLVNLCRKEKLQRQKLGRSYIYFAVDTKTATRQRRAAMLQKAPAEPLPAEIAVFIPLFPKMATLFKTIINDRRFNLAVDELRWRSRIFDRLRGAMRIALPDGHKGLNDDGSPEAMISIRQGVSDFRRYIHKSPHLSADPLTIKMLAQIDKYDDKLFADPIDIDTPAGNVTIFPQRTNNILERFFRSMRRGYRRKTGNNAMRRSLQAMLADTPLVKNLDNSNYMKMLLNKNTSLEELFAEIDGMAAVSMEKSDDNSDRILPGYRSLINLPDLPERLIDSLLKPPAMAKSN